MAEKSKYFVIREKAVPEVLLKVVEAKRLLDSERVLSVQEAVDRVGISRWWSGSWSGAVSRST